MKKLNIAFVILMSLGVVACGSGGGGDSPKSEVQKSQEEFQRRIDFQQRESDEKTRQFFEKRFRAGEEPRSKTPSITFVPDDLKKDVKDAKTLVLLDQNGKPTDTKIALSELPVGIIQERLENGVQTVRGVNLIYSSSMSLYNTHKSMGLQWGMFKDSAIYGIPTKEADLPKGEVSYLGRSVGMNYSGKLSLTANFDEKTVNGLISNRDGGNKDDLNLKGTIFKVPNNKNDETYFGGAVFINDTPKDIFSGAFMGPKADEIIGEVSEVIPPTQEGGENTYRTYENFGAQKVSP